MIDLMILFMYVKEEEYFKSLIYLSLSSFFAFD